MSNIPFTVYDFFAYLSSGAILVATIDYLVGTRSILERDLPLTTIAIFVFSAYIVGHIVAGLSASILEDLFARRVLGSPLLCLQGKPRHPRLRRIFLGYHRPLPEATRRRITDKSAALGFSATDDALFLHAFALVSQKEADRNRLDEFRNLYGFARNVSMSFLLSGLLLAGWTAFAGQPTSYTWSAVTIACGVAMLYRYLKFYRQYSYQLLITYAEYQPGNARKGALSPNSAPS